MLGCLLCSLLPADGVTLASKLTFEDWTNGNTVAVNCPGLAESGVGDPFDLSGDIISTLEQPANLQGAKFVISPPATPGGSILANTILRGANLIGANFGGGFGLPGGRLVPGADLTGADLRGANLTGARLIDANISGVDFRGANLTDVIGLNLGFYVHQVFENPPIYDTHTVFTRANPWLPSEDFDPVVYGWVFVPEPSTSVLSILGTVALSLRRGRAQRTG